MGFDQAEVHYLDTLALGGSPFRWTIHNLDMLNTLGGDYDQARRRASQLAEMEGFDPAADLARIDAIENPALKVHALDFCYSLLRLGDFLRSWVPVLSNCVLTISDPTQVARRTQLATFRESVSGG